MTGRLPDWAELETSKRDVADIKAQAAKWNLGNRIDKPTYRAVCDALNDNRCPQAVYAALVDLAFVKRGVLRPDNPVAIFWGIVRNQEARVLAWALARTATADEEEGTEDDVEIG